MIFLGSFYTYNVIRKHTNLPIIFDNLWKCSVSILWHVDYCRLLGNCRGTIHVRRSTPRFITTDQMCRRHFTLMWQRFLINGLLAGNVRFKLSFISTLISGEWTWNLMTVELQWNNEQKLERHWGFSTSYIPWNARRRTKNLGIQVTTNKAISVFFNRMVTFKWMSVTSNSDLLLCSGDVDSVVPVTATRYAIAQLKLATKVAWYPWYVKKQVSSQQLA